MVGLGEYQRWLDFGDCACMVRLGDYQRWLDFGGHANMAGFWRLPTITRFLRSCRCGYAWRVPEMVGFWSAGDD